MLAKQLSEQAPEEGRKYHPIQNQKDSNEDKNDDEHQRGSELQHSDATTRRLYSSCSNLLLHGGSDDYNDGLIHREQELHGQKEGTNDEDEDDEDISSSEEETDDDDDDDDSELSFDDDSSDEDEETELLINNRKRNRKGKSLQCEALDPILKPMLKLYRLLRDAIILITNVDDVWDSPAYDSTWMERCESMRSMHSVSSGSTIQYRHNSRSSAVSPHMQTRRTFDVPSLSGGQRAATVSLRHKIGVLFWVLVLASFYALERCSFKILADRMGPFRMVVGGEFVLASHALAIASWKGLTCLLCRYRRSGSGIGLDLTNAKHASCGVMLPWPDVGLMAILDSIQLLLVVISGSHVAPVVTAIVVHVTIPLTEIFQQFTKRGIICGNNTDTNSTSNNANVPLQVQEQQTTSVPQNNDDDKEERKQNSQMLFGATLIMLSSILAISPAVLTLINPAMFSSSDVMADRTAWNTLLFLFSYIPGAISQVYKDHTLEVYAQPVDLDLLNLFLSLFSAIFAFLISPILYPLQGLADTPSSPQDESTLKVQTWINQYPTRQSSSNFSDGLVCFTGTLADPTQIGGYPEEAHCDYAYIIVLLHVFSIIVISHAVGKICNAGAFKIMHKGISAGIISSVAALFFYQVFVDDVDYGVIPTMFQITCAAVLVMGSEVYHRVTLETPSFETKYPEAPRLYDDE